MELVIRNITPAKVDMNIKEVTDAILAICADKQKETV